MKAQSLTNAFPVRRAVPAMSTKRFQNLQKSRPLAYTLLTTTGAFSKSSVAAYQKKKVRDLQNSELPKWRLQVCLFVAVALAIVYAVFKACGYLPWYGDMGAVGVTFIVLVFLLTDFFPARPNRYPGATWISEDYYSYLARNSVPQEVQDLVKEMKLRLPQATFVVEFFFKDPFVLMEHVNPRNGREESEYIAFYDENGFVH
jgi:hypothetical protein